MTTPSLPILRPLTMGQIIDQAIRIYRRNFWKFIGIVAAVQVPVTLVQILLAWLTLGSTLSSLQNRYSTATDLFGPGYFLGLLGTMITSVLSIVLLWGVASGALTRTVTDQYLGETISLVEAYRRIRHSVPRLIGAIFFLLVIALGVGIWTLIPCIGWLTGPGILFFLMGAILPLVAPVSVLEGQPAVSAVRRAWDLVRRRFWWVVGFVIILYLFNMLIVSGPGALFTIILQTGAGRLYTSTDPTTALVVQTVVQSLGTLILSLIYLPLQLTCHILMYVDLRVRTEGLDLAFQTARALPDEAGLGAVFTQAPPPGQGNLLSWQDMGYFALISLGALAVIGLIYGAMLVLLLIILGGI